MIVSERTGQQSIELRLDRVEQKQDEIKELWQRLLGVHKGDQGSK